MVAGNLAALDSEGNPVDSGISSTNVATKAEATLKERTGFTDWEYGELTNSGSEVWTWIYE